MPADKPPLFQAGLPSEEFVERRRRLLSRLQDGSHALIAGAGPVERSEPFRQTNEFYYLTGLEIPQAYLLVEHESASARLFVPHRDERQERSEGPNWAAEDADEICRRSGLSSVHSLAEMERYLRDIRCAYVPQSPAEGRAAYRDELLAAARRIAADPWDQHSSRQGRFNDTLSARFPEMIQHDLSPILDDLRLIKSAREVRILRRAGRLTASAVREAMRCTQTGMREYQLHAVAQLVYTNNGARGEGYAPIIAGGPNIWHAHYNRCRDELRDGDLVLMDLAPDVDYYTSDIGRLWPVNGRYSPWQRELAGFITRYHQALLRRIRPGVRPSQVLEEASAEMASVIEESAFSKASYEQAARKTLSFQGHLSHPVGMAVHDVGAYWDRPLEPGLVLSVDPQMWVPEEALYIRVEDTVALTEDGIENLTALAPLGLDEIEDTVGRGGILQQFPPVPGSEGADRG